MSLLTLKNLRYEIEGKLLFEVDNLTIDEGDVIGLIGKNGSGKTCLLKILSGELSDYSGQILGNPVSYYSNLCMTGHIAKSGGEVSISNFIKALSIFSSLLLNFFTLPFAVKSLASSPCLCISFIILSPSSININ